MISGVLSASESALPIIARAPSKIPVMKSKEASIAEWRAANNADLTPQEAFRSGAELGPANSTEPRADNHVSKLHTEIKVGGKVIARVYNSGVTEIANEYSFLADELNFGSDKITGPDLAEDRVRRIKASLEWHGAVMQDELSPTGLLTAKFVNTPVLELLRSTAAQTADQWSDMMVKQGPLDPGTFFSRSA